jgi:phosphohistidine phosphatase
MTADPMPSMDAFTLYLVRHGKAEPRSVDAKDEQRPLAPKGRRQAAWLAEHLAGMPEAKRPRLILTSGFLRARNTAEILRDAIHCDLRHEPLLENSGRNNEVLRLVAEHAERPPRSALVLVGHNPQLEDLLAQMVPDHPFVEIRTGMAAVVALRGGSARLVRTLRLDEDD